jgi:hypothetical protein
VKQQMAVVSPPTERIGRDTVGTLRARRQVDSVLAHMELTFTLRRLQEVDCWR